MYMIVAILLTIIAAFSLSDAIQLIIKMVTTPEIIDGVQNYSKGLLGVIQSLLLTITIIVLFKNRHRILQDKTCRSACIAHRRYHWHGTAYPDLNVTDTNALQMFASIALLAVLIAGVVLVKPEP